MHDAFGGRGVAVINLRAGQMASESWHVMTGQMGLPNDPTHVHTPDEIATGTLWLLERADAYDGRIVDFNLLQGERRYPPEIVADSVARELPLVTDHLVEGDVSVDRWFPRQPEDPLTDDVPLHLVTPPGEGATPGAEPDGDRRCPGGPLPRPRPHRRRRSTIRPVLACSWPVTDPWSLSAELHSPLWEPTRIPVMTLALVRPSTVCSMWTWATRWREPSRRRGAWP